MQHFIGKEMARKLPRFCKMACR